MQYAQVRPLDLLGEMRAAHVHENEDSAPMLLTLQDVRSSPAPARSDPEAAGAAYAELVGRYRQELVPWARDDDQGALITVLKTIGFVAFDTPVESEQP